jgi:hypothetical protein
MFGHSQSSNGVRRVGAAALAAALALCAGTGGPATSAQASIPTGTPVFSNPTAIDHTFFPFEVGGVKVYGGRESGDRITVVDLYLAATRDFSFGGGTVTCRGLQETEFEDGELVEISTNWFAQSDDGTIWYFGETVDDYEDGEVVDHGGSWLVGGPGPGDPVETMTVAAPGLFLPGNPEIGDEFRPEDLPDGSIEVGTIHRLDKKVRVPAGKFTGCLVVKENHLPDGDVETKWYAPGVGLLEEKGRGESLKLEASSFE